VFENGLLRNMFGRKRLAVRGDESRLHDEGLRGLEVRGDGSRLHDE
jgi:hypothetical protein